MVTFSTFERLLILFGLTVFYINCSQSLVMEEECG